MSTLDPASQSLRGVNQKYIVWTAMFGLLLVGCGLVTGYIVNRNQAHADFLTTDKNGGNVYVPTNLRSIGRFDVSTKTSSTTLLWDPSQTAVRYNIYDYDVKIATVSTTSYLVPPEHFHGDTTYTVSAVDANGAESLPSNITMLESDTDTAPTWQSATLANPPALPAHPTFITAYPEWNLGKPRNRIAWPDCQNTNVYRDGVMVAEDMWNGYYIDSTVTPGSTHNYAFSCTIAWWPGHREGPQSTPITVTALTNQPAPLLQKVTINRVVPNDDSVMVYFKPVSGAADYRVYNLATSTYTKYMGVMPPWPTAYQDIKFLPEPHEKNFVPQALPTELSIELNNVNTTTGADLIVEALDKPGPFQKQDGSTGVGSMPPNGGMVSSQLNGQGDPSNVPNAIASSDIFHVTTHPATGLSPNGAQKFFDAFNTNATDPFTPQPASAIDPAIVAAEGGVGEGVYGGVNQFSNSKWNILDHETDQRNSKIFVMSNHFMDTIYDGPTAEVQPFTHNNNASMVMQPKATADISDNKILHATMEVDAHFSGRRWTDIFVGKAGASLVNPRPTKLSSTDEMTQPAANMFIWEITNGGHGLTLQQPPATAGGDRINVDLVQAKDYSDGQTLARSANYSNDYFGTANGTPFDVDKRSRFDLYLSQTHYKIVETSPNGLQLVREKDFPAGTSLGLNNVQVYFDQELYHTGNDHPELLGTADQYWTNYRPWGDERHWDNMGFEVLPANSWGTSAVIPQLEVSAPPHYLSQSTPTPPPTGNNGLHLTGSLSNRNGSVDTSVKAEIKTFGTTIATTIATMDANGSVALTDSNFLNTIPGNTGFSLVIWRKGYCVKSISGQTVLTALANNQPVAFGPLDPGNFINENDSAATPTLSDLIALIRAYNNQPSDTISAAYPGGKVSLGNIITFITTYRTANG